VQNKCNSSLTFNLPAFVKDFDQIFSTFRITGSFKKQLLVTITRLRDFERRGFRHTASIKGDQGYAVQCTNFPFGKIPSRIGYKGANILLPRRVGLNPPCRTRGVSAENEEEKGQQFGGKGKGGSVRNEIDL